MATRSSDGRYLALAAVTGLLLLNFWAWSLLSPLAPTYASELRLSPFAISALLATPVIVGSLGRLPLGALTDKYGGRRIFAVICFLASLPTAYLAFAGSYAELAVAAFFIGIAGASFAVGVPFVNAWFPREKRGFALGLFAMGNAGTAISGLLTPRLSEQFSRPSTFLLVAASLVIAGGLMMLKGRDAPSWKPSRAPMRASLIQAAAWPQARKLAIIYAVTFGAFVAFGLYLPILLRVVYHLEITDAGAKAAGFVVLATLARPVGGWLSDKLGGAAILRAVLLTAAGLAAIAALNPSLMPFGTIVYLSLAIVLGLGNGAVFAVIGHLCDPKRVGSVTGIVGAAGGLGGFFPPLLMGASYQLFHSYSLALLLFTATCLILLPVTFGLGSQRYLATKRT